MSLAPVADGEIAAIVTYLEMRAPPQAEPLPQTLLALVPRPAPSPGEYRALFRKVGARWLWFSRLVMDDSALAANIGELHAVIDAAGAEVGMIELDFTVAGECELAFIGLVPELAGQGHGRWLLAEALRLAWRAGVTKVHVHTCTLDHPAALNFYRRAGFIAVGRAVETFADPRLLGILPADCAPQVPLLGTVTGG